MRNGSLGLLAVVLEQDRVAPQPATQEDVGVEHLPIDSGPCCNDQLNPPYIDFLQLLLKPFQRFLEPRTHIWLSWKAFRAKSAISSARGLAPI